MVSLPGELVDRQHLGPNSWNMGIGGRILVFLSCRIDMIQALDAVGPCTETGIDPCLWDVDARSEVRGISVYTGRGFYALFTP